MLDVHEASTFTDYFVICNGDSSRQIKAIIEEIEKVLKEENVRPSYQVGAVDSGWVILDYGDVLIHVFSPIEREYYQLERAWSKAPVLLRMP